MRPAIEGIEAILFDLDDTLLQTSFTFQKCYLEIARLVPGRIGAKRLVYGKLWGLDRFDETSVKKILEKYRMNEGLIDSLTKKYQRELVHIPIVPGGKELIERLTSNGISLGIVTNGIPAIQYKKIIFSGLKPYFRIIEVPEKKSERKPAKTMFIRGLDDLAVSPKEAMFIGDRIVEDIAPAQKLGMRTVQVFQGRFAYKNMPKTPVLPDYIISGIWDLLDHPVPVVSKGKRRGGEK